MSANRFERQVCSTALGGQKLVFTRDLQAGILMVTGEAAAFCWIKEMFAEPWTIRDGCIWNVHNIYIYMYTVYVFTYIWQLYTIMIYRICTSMYTYVNSIRIVKTIYRWTLILFDFYTYFRYTYKCISQFLVYHLKGGFTSNTCQRVSISFIRTILKSCYMSSKRCGFTTKKTFHCLPGQ